MFGKKDRFIGVIIGVYTEKTQKKRKFKLVYLPSTDYQKTTIMPNGDFRAFKDGRTVFFCPKESLAYAKWREI